MDGEVSNVIKIHLKELLNLWWASDILFRPHSEDSSNTNTIVWLFAKLFEVKRRVPILDKVGSH